MGTIVKDRVTGFEGEIISITSYKYEATDYFVQPQKLQSNGQPVEGESFSAERLIEVTERASTTGFGNTGRTT